MFKILIKTIGFYFVLTINGLNIANAGTFYCGHFNPDYSSSIAIYEHQASVFTESIESLNSLEAELPTPFQIEINSFQVATHNALATLGITPTGFVMDELTKTLLKNGIDTAIITQETGKSLLAAYGEWEAAMTAESILERMRAYKVFAKKLLKAITLFEAGSIMYEAFFGIGKTLAINSDKEYDALKSEVTRAKSVIDYLRKQMDKARKNSKSAAKGALMHQQACELLDKQPLFFAKNPAYFTKHDLNGDGSIGQSYAGIKANWNGVVENTDFEFDGAGRRKKRGNGVGRGGGGGGNIGRPRPVHGGGGGDGGKKDDDCWMRNNQPVCLRI